jgi:membrane-associated phospholipid phosphatase
MAALGLQWLSGWRRVLTVYVLPLWAVAVVSSRVLLQVHRPVDVIAGTLVGFLWGILAFAVVGWSVAR